MLKIVHLFDCQDLRTELPWSETNLCCLNLYSLSAWQGIVNLFFVPLEMSTALYSLHDFLAEVLLLNRLLLAVYCLIADYWGYGHALANLATDGSASSRLKGIEIADCRFENSLKEISRAVLCRWPMKLLCLWFFLAIVNYLEIRRIGCWLSWLTASRRDSPDTLLEHGSRMKWIPSSSHRCWDSISRFELNSKDSPGGWSDSPPMILTCTWVIYSKRPWSCRKFTRGLICDPLCL